MVDSTLFPGTALKVASNRWQRARHVPVLSRKTRDRYRVRFIEKRRAFRAETRMAKHAVYIQRLESLAECRDPSASSLYRRVRSLKRSLPSVSIPTESLAASWNQVWKAKELPDEDKFLEQIALLHAREPDLSERDLALCQDFSMGELTSALALCSRGKSPDFLGHDYDALRSLPSEALELFLRICNRLWQTDTIPPQWMEGWIRFLPKPGGRPDDPRDYRPISLLSVWYKLLERMLWTRIQAWKPAWADAQAGFRPGRSCVAQTGALHIMKEWLQSKRQVAFAAFLDIAKAFDSVSYTAVELKMLRMGFPPRAVNLICRMLRHHRNHVVGGMLDAVVEVGRGAPQGSVLGPFVFLVMINDLPGYLETAVPQWQQEPLLIRSMLWADDTLLVSQDPSTLQALLDACHEWSLRWGLVFNPSKSVILPLGAHHTNLAGRLRRPSHWEVTLSSVRNRPNTSE